MLVLRPVRLEDIDDFMSLVHHVTYGLSTLPPDRDHLAKRIRASLRGFDKVEDPEPAGDVYMFVLVDLDNNRVVGSSAIVSKVGGFQPFYAYRIVTTVHESKQLNIRREVRTLHLVADHNGPTEIGSLFLHPDYRGGGNGRMLSLSRFLFIADHRAQFDDQVLAEMRGVVDVKEGRSAFWDAVGRHFFQIDFPQADHLSVVNKQFIAELMPQHPLYIDLLPAEAQAVIGRVHPHTEPALKILQSEGFRFHDMVDIFEAGPVVQCATDDIRAVRDATHAALDAAGDVDDDTAYLVSNGRRDYRACQSRLETVGKERVRLPAATVDALEVKPGDRISYVPLRPTS